MTEHQIETPSAQPTDGLLLRCRDCQAVTQINEDRRCERCARQHKWIEGTILCAYCGERAEPHGCLGDRCEDCAYECQDIRVISASHGTGYCDSCGPISWEVEGD